MPGVSAFAQNSLAQTFWIALAFVTRFEQPLNHLVDRELQLPLSNLRHYAVEHAIK